MTTLAISFGLSWAAVAAYVAWLARQNRQLTHRLESLEIAAHENRAAPRPARAA